MADLFGHADSCDRALWSHSSGSAHLQGCVIANKRTPGFDTGAFLARAGSGKTVAKYLKNQVVFSQGDQADSVFYIQTGKVKVSVVSEQGKEAVVALLGPDEFFGEGCLAGQIRRMGTASAMSECEVMRLEKTEIMRVLHDEPAFSEMFMTHLLLRKMRVEEDLVDQLFNSSEKRLARALLLMANFGKEGRPETIIAKVSQETLAEMIGTTRSRVSFFMNKFRRLGFIDYHAADPQLAPQRRSLRSAPPSNRRRARRHRSRARGRRFGRVRSGLAGGQRITTTGVPIPTR